MSVLAECVSVIIRVADIERSYPGGLQAYQQDCPNTSYCSDGRLTRVGFMVPADTGAFLEQLVRKGVTLSQTTDTQMVVVVDQVRGPTTPCAWLTGGRHRDGLAAVWLAGEAPGDLAVPEGWNPSDAAMLRRFDPVDVPKRLLRLAREDNTEVWLDFERGREIYVARTEPDNDPTA